MTRPALAALLLLSWLGAARAQDDPTAALQQELLAALEAGPADRWAPPDGALSVEVPQGWYVTRVEGTPALLSRAPFRGGVQVQTQGPTRDLAAGMKQLTGLYRERGDTVLEERIADGVARIHARSTRAGAPGAQLLRIVPRPGRTYILVGVCTGDDEQELARLRAILDSLQLAAPSPPPAPAEGWERVEDEGATLDFPGRPRSTALPDQSGLRRTLHVLEDGPRMHMGTTIHNEKGELPADSLSHLLVGSLRAMQDQGWGVGSRAISARRLRGRPGVLMLLEARQGEVARHFAYWAVQDHDRIYLLTLRSEPEQAEALREAFFGGLRLKR